MEPAPQPSAATDDLIARCLTGDQAAWATIYHQHRRKVFNVAYTFVGRHDEAEDLSQEIFLKVHRNLHTFDRRANFQTWLISVSRNLCIDHYRSVRRERDAIAHEIDPSELSIPSPQDGPLRALERSDLRDLLARALDGLPPALRTAVLMRDMQDRSYLEIAEALGVPDGTVKSRVSRGRHELARQVSRLRREQEVGRHAADRPDREHPHESED